MRIPPRALVYPLLPVLIGAFLPACSLLPRHSRRPASAQLPAPPAPQPHRVGTIALVNTTLHFVLIDVGSLYAPAPGTALKSFTPPAPGLDAAASPAPEPAILAVSPEKRRPFIVADIIRGDPHVGDEVDE